jgi:hypothetical protein
MVILVMCFALPAQAEISKLLALQGRLSDSNGQALNGNFSLTFRIYNASTGGTKLWEETQALTLSAGVFNVQLGSVKPFNLAFDQPYWVEIATAQETFSPRQPLTASAYAFRAGQLEGLAVVDAKLGIGTSTPFAKLHINAGSQWAVIVDRGTNQLRIDGMRGGPGTGGPITLTANNDIGLDARGATVSPTQLYLDNTGRVGLSTTSPKAQLEISSIGENTRWYRSDLRGNYSHALYGASGDWYIRPSLASGKVVIADTGGKVAIGTPNPGNYQLYVNGAAYATGGFQGSSLHLKTGLKQLTPQEEQALLAKLNQLAIYHYRLKQSDNLKTTHLGIIAEEAPEELVDDAHKALSYGDTLAVLLAAFKAQQAEIATLKEEVAQLKDRYK